MTRTTATTAAAGNTTYTYRVVVEPDEVRFGAVTDAEGDQHRHVQAFEIRRATGPAALRGVDGEIILTGHTGEVVKSGTGVVAFAGLAPICRKSWSFPGSKRQHEGREARDRCVRRGRGPHLFRDLGRPRPGRTQITG